MQRYEVEAIFEQKKDGLFEDINISSQKPIAIILGGQPACGKSTLINVAKKDHPNLDFLTVNGDLYRQFHPNKELIKDPIKYPIETQIFSSVFTEKLIEEVLSKGQGRLADIDSHNKAVNGLMKSANQLYSDKAVDKISIHTYLAKERIKDFNLVNGEWSCKSMPSIFIDESRSKQMKNKEILNTNIQRGKELIESVTNPEVKKGMKEALSQLQSSLEKVQRQEKGLKKGFF